MKPFPFAIWPALKKAESPLDVYGQKNLGQIRLELLRSPLHPKFGTFPGGVLPESTFSGLVRCVDTGRIGALIDGIHPYRTTLEKFGGSLLDDRVDTAFMERTLKDGRRQTVRGFLWNALGNAFRPGSPLKGNSRPILYTPYYSNQISQGKNVDEPFFEPVSKIMASGEAPHFYVPYMRDAMEFRTAKYKTPFAVLAGLREQGELDDKALAELQERYGKFYEEGRPLTVQWDGTSLVLTVKSEKLFDKFVQSYGEAFKNVPKASVFWLDGQGYGPSLRAPAAEPYITGGGMHGGFLTLGVGEGGLSHGDADRWEREDAGEVARAMSRRGTAIRKLIRQKVLPFVMAVNGAPKIPIGRLGVEATSNLQFAGLRIAPDLEHHYDLLRQNEIVEAERSAKRAIPIPYTPDQFPLWHQNYRRQWPTAPGRQWYSQQGDRHYMAHVPSFAPGAMEGDTETIKERQSRFGKEYQRRLKEWMDTYRHDEYANRTFSEIIDDERAFQRLMGRGLPRGFLGGVRRDFIRHLYDKGHRERFAEQYGLPNDASQLDEWMKRSVDYDVPTMVASHTEDVKSPLPDIEPVLVPKPNFGQKGPKEKNI